MNEHIDDLPKMIMKAHGGKMDTTLQVFFKKKQNFDETLNNSNYKNPKNNSLWNFFAYAEFPVGATAGKHRHLGNDEIMYVLEGRADIIVDGKRSIMKPGTAILTQSGSEHYIENVTEFLKFLTIEILTLDSIGES